MGCLKQSVFLNSIGWAAFHPKQTEDIGESWHCVLAEN